MYDYAREHLGPISDRLTRNRDNPSFTVDLEPSFAEVAVDTAIEYASKNGFDLAAIGACLVSIPGIYQAFRL